MPSPSLRPGEHVVCAFAERAAGPGWANAPIWVIVRDVNGEMRLECLQPIEQTNEMLVLYNVSNEVHGLMKSLAEKALKGSACYSTP